MRRLRSRISAGGNARRAAMRFVVLVLACAAGLELPAVRAGARDKARGSKRRAAESEAAKDAQPTLPDVETEGASDESPGKSSLTLRDVIAFTKESRDALQDVKDYTAHFSKKERIKGRLVEQEMEMKFRTKPFSVYFLYQSREEQGRQAIYVDGRNNNNLLVKEAKGLAGTLGVSVPLRLDDPRVKAENLYPVTHVGIANMLESTIKEWEHELQVPGDELEVQFYPNAKEKGVPCQAIEVTHLKKLKELKYFRNRLFIDKETKLPIRGIRFGWPQRPGDEPPIVEDYRYSNIKTNLNLTDADFNPARYGF